MHTDGLRQLLSRDFYEHGLADAAKTCFAIARDGTHVVAFFALGNIFRDLSIHFEANAPITRQESERFASLYRTPVTHLLDLIEAGKPAQQIADQLEKVVLLHITAHL